jgi:hypothetical protein
MLVIVVDRGGGSMSRIVSGKSPRGSRSTALVGVSLPGAFGAGDVGESLMDSINDFSTAWAALIALAIGLLLLAVLVFAKVGPGTMLTRREKVLRSLVIVAAALLIFVMLSRNVFWVVLLYGVFFACWAMFLARWIAPQVGDATDYVGRAFSEEKREAARERSASQEAQSERGDAMEDLLEDIIEERGDEELIEESEHGEE